MNLPAFLPVVLDPPPTPVNNQVRWNQSVDIKPPLEHKRITNKKRRFKGMLAVVGQSPPGEHI